MVHISVEQQALACERQLQTIGILIDDEYCKLRAFEKRAEDVCRSWGFKQPLAAARGNADTTDDSITHGTTPDQSQNKNNNTNDSSTTNVAQASSSSLLGGISLGDHSIAGERQLALPWITTATSLLAGDVPENVLSEHQRSEISQFDLEVRGAQEQIEILRMLEAHEAGQLATLENERLVEQQHAQQDNSVNSSRLTATDHSMASADTSAAAAASDAEHSLHLSTAADDFLTKAARYMERTGPIDERSGSTGPPDTAWLVDRHKHLRLSQGGSSKSGDANDGAARRSVVARPFVGHASTNMSDLVPVGTSHGLPTTKREVPFQPSANDIARSMNTIEDMQQIVAELLTEANRLTNQRNLFLTMLEKNGIAVDPRYKQQQSGLSPKRAAVSTLISAIRLAFIRLMRVDPMQHTASQASEADFFVEVLGDSTRRSSIAVTNSAENAADATSSDADGGNPGPLRRTSALMTIEALEALIHDLDGQGKTLRQQLVKADKQAITLNCTVEELKGDVRAALDDCGETRKALMREESTTAQLRLDLEVKAEEVAVARGEVVDLQEEVQCLHQRMEELAATNEQIAASWEEHSELLNTARAQHEEEVSALQRKIHVLEINADRLATYKPFLNVIHEQHMIEESRLHSRNASPSPPARNTNEAPLPLSPSAATTSPPSASGSSVTISVEPVLVPTVSPVRYEATGREHAAAASETKPTEDSRSKLQRAILQTVMERREAEVADLRRQVAELQTRLGQPEGTAQRGGKKGGKGRKTDKVTNSEAGNDAAPPRPPPTAALQHEVLRRKERQVTQLQQELEEARAEVDNTRRLLEERKTTEQKRGTSAAPGSVNDQEEAKKQQVRFDIQEKVLRRKENEVIELHRQLAEVNLKAQGLEAERDKLLLSSQGEGEAKQGTSSKNDNNSKQTSSSGSGDKPRSSTTTTTKGARKADSGSAAEHAGGKDEPMSPVTAATTGEPVKEGEGSNNATGEAQGSKRSRRRGKSSSPVDEAGDGSQSARKPQNEPSKAASPVENRDGDPTPSEALALSESQSGMSESKRKNRRGGRRGKKEGE